MLKYSIKRRPVFISAFDRLTQRRTETPLLLSRPEFIPISWDKIEFIIWFEGHVRDKFKAGDKVTFSHVPVQARVAPICMTIRYVQELYNAAQFSTRQNEPAVISVVHFGGQTTLKCPCELRLLTKEEIALVDLQYTKAQGTA